MITFALVASVSLFFTSIGGTSQSASPSSANPLFGFRNSEEENAVESRFLAVPDPKLAEAHLRTLTQAPRSEEHTSELQSRGHLVCRLLLEKKKHKKKLPIAYK